jgi:hypothetical protein
MSSAKQVDFVISQEEAWSDDFNDGNIDGWDVQGFDSSTDPWTPLPGNITAEDNTMRVYSEEWSEAYRTSNVAYGSWAFDVYCVDTPLQRSYIAFVSGSPPLDPPDLYSMPFEYGIIAVTGWYEGRNTGFILYRRPSVSPYLVQMGFYDLEEVSGWYHIDITRDPNGNFEVRFNGTLGITAENSNHTTCDLFTFTAGAGIALDNIVVKPYSGSLPLEMTLLLVAGGGIAVVVIIGIVIRLRKRID